MDDKAKNQLEQYPIRKTNTTENGAKQSMSDVTHGIASHCIIRKNYVSIRYLFFILHFFLIDFMNV
jgi:hypothetical protein